MDMTCYWSSGWYQSTCCLMWAEVEVLLGKKLWSCTRLVVFSHSLIIQDDVQKHDGGAGGVDRNSGCSDQ